MLEKQQMTTAFKRRYIGLPFALIEFSPIIRGIFSPKTKKFLKRLENALSEFLIYFSLFVFFVEKSFFARFFDFWSIFFVGFAISLAAMSLEYSLAKARGNYSIQICLDFQIITILRSRF